MSSQVLSPYKLKEETEGVYSFVSDQDYTFTLSFQKANDKDGFANNSNVQEKLRIVNFRPVPNIEDIRDIRDPRIANTILKYIEKWFYYKFPVFRFRWIR